MTLSFDSSYRSSYIGGYADKTASAGLNKTSSFLSQFAVRFSGSERRKGIPEEASCGTPIVQVSGKVPNVRFPPPCI
jgi:hypothetical protein